LKKDEKLIRTLRAAPARVLTFFGLGDIHGQISAITSNFSIQVSNDRFTSIICIMKKGPREPNKRETLNNSSKITRLRMEIFFGEYDMRKVPARERVDKIIRVLRNERDDVCNRILFGLQER
jgi:acid phosphatase class B